jgi:hypothetical protein
MSFAVHNGPAKKGFLDALLEHLGDILYRLAGGL